MLGRHRRRSRDGQTVYGQTLAVRSPPEVAAHNITMTTRLVDTVTTSMLLKMVASGKLAPGKLATHRFPLTDVMKAYDTFSHAARERALKVILKND